jgi:hypothetical protein
MGEPRSRDGAKIAAKAGGTFKTHAMAERQAAETAKE